MQPPQQLPLRRQLLLGLARRRARMRRGWRCCCSRPGCPLATRGRRPARRKAGGLEGWSWQRAGLPSPAHPLPRAPAPPPHRCPRSSAHRALRRAPAGRRGQLRSQTEMPPLEAYACTRASPLPRDPPDMPTGIVLAQRCSLRLPVLGSVFCSQPLSCKHILACRPRGLSGMLQLAS